MKWTLSHTQLNLKIKKEIQVDRVIKEHSLKHIFHKSENKRSCDWGNEYQNVSGPHRGPQEAEGTNTSFFLTRQVSAVKEGDLLGSLKFTRSNSYVHDERLVCQSMHGVFSCPNINWDEFKANQKCCACFSTFKHLLSLTHERVRVHCSLCVFTSCTVCDWV